MSLYQLDNYRTLDAIDTITTYLKSRINAVELAGTGKRENGAICTGASGEIKWTTEKR
jgi:hypothetical protein